MKWGTSTNYYTEACKNKIETRIIKNILKNGIVCRDIKTEKAQEQDWDGTLATKLNLTTST